MVSHDPWLVSHAQCLENIIGGVPAQFVGLAYYIGTSDQTHNTRGLNTCIDNSYIGGCEPHYYICAILTFVVNLLLH